MYQCSTGISCAFSGKDLLCSRMCKYCLGLVLFCFVFLSQMLAKEIELYKHN